MKLKPVLTEKSLEEAKKGTYTFLVDRGWNKGKIAEVISEALDVVVKKVRTINYKSTIKKNHMGRKRVISGKKKAMITLKTKDLPKGKKDKIDLFETKK